MEDFQCHTAGLTLSPTGVGWHQISSQLTRSMPSFPYSYNSSQTKKNEPEVQQSTLPWAGRPVLAQAASPPGPWGRVAHRGWLLKNALLSLHTGLTQSGQHRVSWREHTSLDCRWEHTRSARACRAQGTMVRGSKSSWAFPPAQPL